MPDDSPSPEPRRDIRATTGIEGLDDILGGGFTPHRLYLLEGVPGSGKTTLALQFLLEGVRRGEPVLYVTLSETEEELRGVAASHGWSLDGITIRELVPSEDSLRPDEQYTMFHPSEVELSETTKTILADVERIKPARVVFDSLSELRLLAGNPLRYRRQILALKQFFAGRNCTVLLLDDLTSTNHDLQVQSIAHGVVRLEQLHPEYGSERRRLIVLKFRGVRFRGGYHDYVIRRGGIEVFPRLVASEHRPPLVMEKLASGIAEMDTLLGGGIERGTSTLIVGAAGTGKSSLAAQFVAAAAARGQNAALFIFDESLNTLLTPRRRAGNRPAEAHRRGPRHRAAGGSGRTVAGRVRPRHPPGRRAAEGLRRGHRQLERLPQRHARGALPDHSTARTVDVPGSGGRRHDPDRRPSGTDRRPDDHPSSSSGSKPFGISSMRAPG